MKKLAWLGMFLAAAYFLVRACSASAADLAELRKLTKLTLNQDTLATAVNYPNSMIDRWVNDAIKVVSKGAGCVERETTLVVLKDKATYTMPSDYIRAQGLLLAMTGELVYQPRGLKARPQSELGSEAGSRVEGPKVFTDKGAKIKKIVLSPAPLLDVDTAVVTYLAYGQTLTTDTSTCDLPDEYLGAVSLYAAWRCWAAKQTGSNPYRDDLFSLLQLLGVAYDRPRDETPPSEVPNTP